MRSLTSAKHFLLMIRRKRLLKRRNHTNRIHMVQQRLHRQRSVHRILRMKKLSLPRTRFMTARDCLSLSRHCRSENVALHGARLGQDASRLDHVFATRGAEVRWTGVVEGAGWAEASDHARVEFGCGSGAEDGAS